MPYEAVRRVQHIDVHHQLPATDSASDTEMDRFLTRGREFTRQELQDALGLNKTGAVSRLSELVDSGKIVRIGKGRGTRYRVI